MPEIGGVGPGSPGISSGTSPAGASASPGPAVGPSLAQGQVLGVQIVEHLDQGEAVVSVGGRLVRASVPDGVLRGELVRLRVVALGPPLALELPESAEAALTRLSRPPADGLASAVRALLAADLPAASPEGALLASARGLLQLPTAPADLAAALARWLQGSGVFHEAHLARGEAPEDLKALLGKLLARLPEGTLARAAGAVLHHVDAHQARGALTGHPVLPLLLPWGPDFVPGEWRLEERPGTRGGEPSGCLVLRLQFPALGAVEARIRWGAAGVAVRLALEPQSLAALGPRLEDLAGALRGAGVRLRDLRAEVALAPDPGEGGLLEVRA